MFDQVDRRALLRWTLVFLALAVLVAWANRDHGSERTIFERHHVGIAEHLAGESEREILTYPMWGYALLLLAVGKGWGVVALQIVLSSVVLALFMLVLRGALPGYAGWVTAACVAGFPWYCLHSVRWPDAPAGALLVLAVIALLWSAESGRIGWSAVAGALAGCALNMRPEKLLLPVALLAAWAIARGIWGPTRLRALHVVVLAAVAWTLMLPWALHHRQQTGSFSLTSTNGGMVAFLSLGQLPGNPWKVRHRDQYADQVVAEAGIEGPAYSVEGHRYLMSRFREAVREHPGAYLRKLMWNLRSMVMGGFYAGDPELDGDEQLQLDVIREKIKLAAGVNPNEAEIQAYREQGIWDEPRVSVGVVAIIVWLVVATAVGALFVLVALVGMVLAVPRIGRDPLLLVCATAIVYRIALVAALQYQPRHLSGVFAFMIPFFAIAMGTVVGALAGLRERWGGPR